jgi:hypothetical protein
MFGRKRRVEAELLELVRHELESLRSEVQRSLADTAAGLTTRVRTEIEQRMGEPRALVAGLAEVRESLAQREAQVSQTLQRVAETCDALAERIKLDRVERTVLADAVNRLAAALTVAGPVPVPALRSSVIGGTIDPDHADTVTTEAVLAEPTDEVTHLLEIDLEAEAAIDAHAESVETVEPLLEAPVIEPVDPLPPVSEARSVPTDGVEVRCRFGDRWVTGFEVCEVIRFDDVTRYRLRRRSDGSVLPTLFEDRDVRFFTSLGESR